VLLLTLFLVGVVIALDPLPLTAFIVVLPSRRGARKGAACTFGWLVSLAIVVAITVAAPAITPQAEHGTLTGRALAVKITIGAGLIGIAIRQRRRLGKPKSQEAAEVAGARGQHVPVVRHDPGPDASALGPDRRGRGRRRGGQAVQLGGLPGSTPTPTR
jgi:hypothetical protein